MNLSEFWSSYEEVVITALGFFWKAGWAFVLGYFISALIQTFVPRTRLTKYMGKTNAKSITYASVFGAISSSCSFAALAATRAIVIKGASFVAAVAFMFASTNLVIELGILIYIFLGWEYLAAEIIGGVILIIISSILMKLYYPVRWFDAARKRLEDHDDTDEEFDWKQRIRSMNGWRMVGHKFVMDWKMVWEEIVIGFTIAGIVSVVVPPEVWGTIFLQDYKGSLPEWIIVVENALVAPLVASLTFIGSMGNIPLATILSANGVLFAGIIGFIYSDLMIPPLVRINAKYYGWRIALYIAATMFVSIVSTALILHAAFGLLGIIPESTRELQQITQFKVDYTFWMNLIFTSLALVLIYLNRKHHKQEHDKHQDHDHQEHQEHTSVSIKRWLVYIIFTVMVVGVISILISG
jgi:uncharacterized membrane protein YraQ (UPF0718 family)